MIPSLRKDKGIRERRERIKLPPRRDGTKTPKNPKKSSIYLSTDLLYLYSRNSWPIHRSRARRVEKDTRFAQVFRVTLIVPPPSSSPPLLLLLGPGTDVNKFRILAA